MSSTADLEPGIPTPTRHPPLGWVSKGFNLPFLGLILLYRVTLSPLVGGQCRFEPTCSRYALGAYRAHGPILGTVMTAKRLLRCHPLSRGGYDPVPLNEPPERIR